MTPRPRWEWPGQRSHRHLRHAVTPCRLGTVLQVSLTRWHCGFLFPAKRAARQGGARKKGPLTWRCQPQRGLCVQGVQAASATPRTPPPGHLLALTPSVGCSWRLTSSKRKAAEGTDVIPRPGSTEAASVQGAPPLLAGPRGGRRPRARFPQTGPRGEGQARPQRKRASQRGKKRQPSQHKTWGPRTAGPRGKGRPVQAEAEAWVGFRLRKAKCASRRLGSHVQNKTGLTASRVGGDKRDGSRRDGWRHPEWSR